MKKALLVGINDYPGTFNDLMGCVNDVYNMQDLLTSLFCFKAEDITILTDKDATALNILKALEMLVYDAKPGDKLIFHYSGHGSQMPDTSGDEKDRFDEILCPFDLDWCEDVVRDDDLNRIFEPVPAGVHVEVFLDSCHSGTGLRAAEGSYRKQRFLPVPAQMLPCKGAIKTANPIKPARVQVLWAACKSNQSAADALLDGKYGGAFTTFLCDLVRNTNGATPRKDLLTALRKALKEDRFSQIPQLETNTTLKNVRILSA